MSRVRYDSLYERIMAHTTTLDWQNENGCWIWTGRLDKDGYGRLNLRVSGQHVTVRVHKLVWEMFNGPLPEGMTLDHLDCVGKACHNPMHLEPVTRTENSVRSQRRNPRAPPTIRRSSTSP